MSRRPVGEDKEPMEPVVLPYRPRNSGGGARLDAGQEGTGSVMVDPRPAATRASGVIGAWNDFWFAPMDPATLHGLRLTGGLLLVAWMISFWGAEGAFYGPYGWYDAQARTEAAALATTDGVPVVLGWSVLDVAQANWQTSLLFLFFLGATILFTQGVGTRVTAPLAWIGLASYTAQPFLWYDG
ncbi:MAG: hypothetical protein ACRDD1_01625, partial [Planctomycetia bacterium]